MPVDDPAPDPGRTRPAIVAATLAALALVAGLVLAVAPPPSPALATSAIGDRGRTVSGWLPYWTMPASVADVVAHGTSVGIASPFWYDLDTPEHLTKYPGAGDANVVAKLRTAGASVMPTVVSSIGAAHMVGALKHQATRAEMEARLVTLAATHGYDGIDLDFERMAATATHRQAKRLASLYVTFVSELAGHLHARGLQLSVTVMPRTDASTWHTGMSAVIYDYAGLGTAADTLRIMAYNRHMPGTRPGGVAPLPWVRDVLDYAVAHVPPERVELGVPTYGFDWVDTTTTGHSVTFRTARWLRHRHDATVEWHDVSGEPSFRYRDHGVRHVVWYSSARSIRARAAVAADYGLRGITLWYLGGEAPAAW